MMCGNLHIEEETITKNVSFGRACCRIKNPYFFKHCLGSITFDFGPVSDPSSRLRLERKNVHGVEQNGLKGPKGNVGTIIRNGGTEFTYKIDMERHFVTN
jgi:hypothetical protein